MLAKHETNSISLDGKLIHEHLWLQFFNLEWNKDCNRHTHTYTHSCVVLNNKVINSVKIHRLLSKGRLSPHSHRKSNLVVSTSGKRHKIQPIVICLLLWLKNKTCLIIWPWLFQFRLSSPLLSCASMASSWRWTSGCSTSSMELVTCSQAVGRRETHWNTCVHWKDKKQTKKKKNLGVATERSDRSPERQDRLLSSLKPLFLDASPSSWLNWCWTLSNLKHVFFSLLNIKCNHLIEGAAGCVWEPYSRRVNYVRDCSFIVSWHFIKIAILPLCLFPIKANEWKKDSVCG